MRSVFAGVLVFAVLLAVPALAAEPSTTQHSTMKHTMKGEITAWDAAAKTFTVKGHDGKQVSFSWTDKTTVEGTPKVGVMTEVEYKYEKEGEARVAEKIVVVVTKK